MYATWVEANIKINFIWALQHLKRVSVNYFLIPVFWGDSFSTYQRIFRKSDSSHHRDTSEPFGFSSFDCQRCFSYLISFKTSTSVKSKFVFCYRYFFLLSAYFSKFSN